MYSHMDSYASLLRGRTALFATMHGKESVVAPLFKQELDVQVCVPTDFNTDQFGSFTGEVPRFGSQLEAARAKARTAMNHYGYDLGIASEGSIGPHPHIPFAQLSLEIIVLIDIRHDVELVGSYSSAAVNAHAATVTSAEEALERAHAWGFPHQGVIIRKHSRDTAHIHKNIHTADDISRAARAVLDSYPRYVQILYRLAGIPCTLSIETDMRAHKHPTRMECIGHAAQNLIHTCKKRSLDNV